ncbi:MULTISPECIES: type II toxin-antitoxin system HicB family antitoxin [Methanosarcina]|uniref:type II toxin-antitoxin system HicB family antitoxin n=1 Tax=Methanosarcina TaxID=2207 RepID=UPI0009BA53D8|nr:MULTISPECIES: type II toxin-antitoxin system HicB family antitoxin [Methanosarcina]
MEKDKDGIYIASVPELPGCHTQAETLDELSRRIKEAIELYIEVEAEKGQEKHLDF